MPGRTTAPEPDLAREALIHGFQRLSRNFKNELSKVFRIGFSNIYYLTVLKFLECYF